MEADSDFSNHMKNLDINLERTPMGLAPRQPPASWTWWHHELYAETIRLVPRYQYTTESVY